MFNSIDVIFAKSCLICKMKVKLLQKFKTNIERETVALQKFKTYVESETVAGV